jgi:hypothetical protein
LETDPIEQGADCLFKPGRGLPVLYDGTERSLRSHCNAEKGQETRNPDPFKDSGEYQTSKDESAVRGIGAGKDEEKTHRAEPTLSYWLCTVGAGFLSSTGRRRIG